jgi:hypothetical protein
MTENPAVRLSQELSPQQAASSSTPLPEFTALIDIPAYLGYRAHIRLEEALGTPIASDDARPQEINEQTGSRSGTQLGSIVGREKEYTRNLSNIKNNISTNAEERGVPESQVWDEVTEILIGSGIGLPMHRTLDRSVGGSYGARTFIDDRVKGGQAGIALIVRENIANWGGRRHDRHLALLGSMSRAALQGVEVIIYAGGGRIYNGLELWRPELQPYIYEEEGKKLCSLTEATAAERIHIPRVKEILGALGVSENVEVGLASVDDKKASGEAVVKAIIEAYGDRLKNMLIIESGNAPAGFTQLESGLILANELGIDPTEQFLAVTDGVEIQHPDNFAALNLEERSKVQNAATALNSINGWLRNIVRVNERQLSAKA